MRCWSQEALAEEQRLAARFVNDIEIAKAQRDFELKQAAYDQEVHTKKAQSDLAYSLQVFVLYCCIINPNLRDLRRKQLFPKSITVAQNVVQYFRRYVKLLSSMNIYNVCMLFFWNLPVKMLCIYMILKQMLKKLGKK